MAGLLHFARLEMQLLVWGFVAVVFYQMVTGRISLKGLLSDGRNSLSGPRIQMLVTNFVVLAAYLGDPAEITRDSTQSALVTAGVMGGVLWEERLGGGWWAGGGGEGPYHDPSNILEYYLKGN